MKQTKKGMMNDIISRKNAGQTLTAEEQAAYELCRKDTNAKNKIWRDARMAAKPPKPEKPMIAEIQRRMKQGLPLISEEAATYDAWREKKMEYQREWREKNGGYHREWEAKKKANAALPIAANQ